MKNQNQVILMEKPWYENRNKILELAEFMVDSEEMTTAKELLDYFKNPIKFSEVWKIYEEEIGRQKLPNRKSPSH